MVDVEKKDLYSNDPYYLSKNKLNIKFPLVTDHQRSLLFNIDDKLEEFETIIKKSVTNYRDCFCNGLILTGAPGTGKTYNIKKWLNELVEQKKLGGYDEFSGKISPITLFKVMKDASEKENNVLLLDDCDVFTQPESLNILKAALNTSTNNDSTGFRRVSYGTKGQVSSFDFKSYLIMITNETFQREGNNDISEHMKAVLDRVHLMNVTLTPEDINIKNLSIVEEFINNSSNLREDTKNELIKVFHEEISEFINYGCFERCKINLPIRFFMKLADLIILFGTSWKSFSTDYKRLKANLEMSKNGIGVLKRL